MVKYKIQIIKKNGKYIWKTRRNRELVYIPEPDLDYFIDMQGGGIIKVIKKSVRNKQWFYMETMTHKMEVFTYWEFSDVYQP